MDETLTDILCRGVGWGGRLSGPGGSAWRWHAGHLESASKFSPYMMLHVLFFLDLLWDVKGKEGRLLSGSPAAILQSTCFISFIILHG